VKWCCESFQYFHSEVGERGCGVFAQQSGAPVLQFRSIAKEDVEDFLLTQIAGADATLDFGYDGTLQTTETWSGAGITTASVTRSYDDSFRVDSLQVNAETPVAYVYDDDDLLVQAGNLVLSRDPQNGLLTGTTITEGAGTVDDTYEYNDFGELEHYEARHNGVEILDFVYMRDELGRIESIVETKNTTGTPVVKERHYQYDLAGRLYRVCPDVACTTVLSEYQYDPNDNRIAGSFNGQGTITSAVYDDQDRLLELTQGPTTTTYTYTDNGELLTKTDPSGTTSYEYDQLGNLLSVTPPSGPQIEYLIDARNRRTGKKVGGVLEKQWIYQDQLNPVAELDGSGNLVSEFVYAAKGNVPSFIISHDDPAPGQTTTYQVLSDHLGSVRVVGAIDGASLGVVEEIEYDEFGVASMASSLQPFGFSGGLHEDTGLVRVGARDVVPRNGRWLSADPIGFVGRQSNLYVYVANDPVNLTDPTGTISSGISVAFGGALAGTLRGLSVGFAVGVTKGFLTGESVSCSFELGARGAVVGAAFGAVRGAFLAVRQFYPIFTELNQVQAFTNGDLVSFSFQFAARRLTTGPTAVFVGAAGLADPAGDGATGACARTL